MRFENTWAFNLYFAQIALLVLIVISAKQLNSKMIKVFGKKPMVF